MATQYNILERYGIKEVADVVFIDIATGKPVLYLDSLKVSTIEETAENTEARGGKGNAPLLSWDYGKEINVTITDALYSPKSLTLMHSQNLSDLHVYNPGSSDPAVVAAQDLAITKYKNLYIDKDGKIEGEEGTATAANLFTAASTSVSDATSFLTKIGVDAKEAAAVTSISGSTVLKLYRAEDNAAYGETISTGITFNEIKNGEVYIVEYKVNPTTKAVLNINADTFPGTYKVVGDTYARNNRTGQDEFFQFVIQKAKMNPETTITLEAEGDPTVFDMSLRVLRPNNGVMMQLIQYTFNEAEDATVGNAVNVHYDDKVELYPIAGNAGAGTA